MIHVVAFALGLFAWTFLEYVLHRWFHTARGRNLASREHLRHHGRPDWFTPLLPKALVLAAIIATAAALSTVLAGAAVAATFAGGIALAFFGYDALHRRAHLKAPRNRYGARVRARHFHHHFSAPDMNHGVTTSLWDRVFGTYQEPGLVPVPKKHAHALAWVLDQNGAIAARFADRYRLV